MNNLRILHIDLDTGKMVAKKGSIGGGVTGNYVELTGSTMSGFLTLHADPVDQMHAANKKYVDDIADDVMESTSSAITALAQSVSTHYIKKAGDTMSGFLTLQADPIHQLHAATKNYVDQNTISVHGGTVQGYLNLLQQPTNDAHAANKLYVDSKFDQVGDIDAFVTRDGSTMTGYLNLHADPVDPMQAATKNYVDSVATGLDVKESVRAATTSNILALGGLLTVDGVALLPGDRVLVKDQTDALMNGIYVVASGFWARSGDMDGSPSTETTPGAFAFVEEGEVNGNTGWVLSTNGPITIGSTELIFHKFTATGEYVAIGGDVMEGFLTLHSDPTQPMHATTKSYTDKLVREIGYKYSQDIPSSSWVISHDKNSTNVIVQVFDGDEVVIPDAIRIVNENVIEVTLGSAMTGSAHVVFFG